MKGVAVQKSRNGQGIFATKDFTAGEVVFEVKGTLISCDEDEEIDEKTRDNAFRFDSEMYVSPAGELGDFLNHSCNPNSAVVKKGNALCVVAVKDIDADEEVTIDYATIIASDDSWHMDCNCGAEQCRGRIAQFASLPADVKDTYLSLGMVPDYIMC